MKRDTVINMRYYMPREYVRGYYNDIALLAFPTLKGEITENPYRIDDWWEKAGHQNWTKGFENELKKMSGYDIRQYLPTIAGRVVRSADETERFLWDFCKTVSDLIVKYILQEGNPTSDVLYYVGEDATVDLLIVNQ